VIVGLGGNDALFGPLVESMITEQRAKAGTLEGVANQLLDSQLPDQTYRDHARDTKEGYAPTLVARLLQVLDAIKNRSDTAKLFIQNYPMAVDPGETASFDMLAAKDLQTMQEFAEKVNAAIRRAVEICGCGTLVDVSNALEGRELNTADPAINSVWVGTRGQRSRGKMSEPFHPSLPGAAHVGGYRERVGQGFWSQYPSGSRRSACRRQQNQNQEQPRAGHRRRWRSRLQGRQLGRRQIPQQLGPGSEHKEPALATEAGTREGNAGSESPPSPEPARPAGTRGAASASGRWQRRR
jgi:hypothetical protein